MCNKEGLQITWFIILCMLPSAGLVGLTLGSVYAAQMNDELYIQNNWKTSTCNIIEIGTVYTPCKGGCYRPAWKVWYLDKSDQNITTICKKDIKIYNRNSLAYDEALKFPPGSATECWYDPVTLQDCRLRAPDPETAKIIMAWMYGFMMTLPILAWSVHILYRSRCCTRDRWSVI